MKEMNFQEKVGIYTWFKKKHKFEYDQPWQNLWIWHILCTCLKAKKKVRKDKLIFSIVALITFD